MFVSLVGCAVDIRPPRVHVPAFADSYLPAGTVSLKAGLYTYNCSGADCLQRPLRSRFRQQLTAGVRLQTAGCLGVNKRILSKARRGPRA
jgi:hypothetical protein